MPPVEIIELIAFVVYFIIFVVLHLSSRVPIGTALAFLVAVAVFVALGNEDLANKLALYTFYFLVVGTILSLVQHYRGKREG